MVITKLIGGIGNQLFQYAVGRHKSLLSKSELKLDVTGFEHYPLRKYSLHAFNIEESFASEEEIYQAKKKVTRRTWRYFSPLLERMVGPKKRWTAFRELNVMPYNPAVLRAEGNIYLEGYWQSEKYFVGIGDTIRREFTMKAQPGPESKEMAEKILSTQSVSVHFRRGDYESNEVTRKVHGVLGKEYYEAAIKIIRQRVRDPHLFLFSDDADWVAENVDLGRPAIIVGHHPGVSSYEELWLMSLCKHNIIANSSFSWWGAWLNANKDKVAVAPERWFNVPMYDTSDLIPQGWLKI